MENLDELDLMLVQELEQDARVSYAALASKLGTSPPTVRRRLTKLIDRGIITIGALSDHIALGYPTIINFGINAAPGTLNTLAEQLASINKIKYIYFTAGRYDILAIALYQNPQEYMRTFPAEIGSILGNSRIEIILSAQTLKRSWSLLTHNNAAAITANTRFVPTELDLSLIRSLEKSPRASAKELAQNVGASLSSVSLSLSKLTSQGIVRVICIPDPAFFGYAVSGITLIKAHPSSLNTLTDKLRNYPSINVITLTFGAFDCMIWTAFQNSGQMSDFLVQDLSNMPEVAHHESLICLRMRKRAHTLLSDI